MKALVTGTSGFIGSHVAEALLAKGVEVRCLTRKPGKLPWIDENRVEVAVASFEDPVSLRKAVEGIDMVYHVAGVTAARSKAAFFAGNMIPTRNLLAAAIDVGTVKRFLHMSTMAVVGPSYDGTPLEESHPYNPLTAYAESKQAAEEEVLRHQDKIAVTITRPPAVYGPRDTGVYEFFRTVNMGILPLIGFDHKLVSLVHARDLAHGAVLAAESDKGEGEIFFISSEQFYDWRTVGTLTKNAIGKRTITIHLPHGLVLTVAAISEFLGQFSKKPPILDREKGADIVQRYWICSVEKAKRLLGYHQQVPLEEGIVETVRWYKEHKWL